MRGWTGGSEPENRESRNQELGGREPGVVEIGIGNEMGKMEREVGICYPIIHPIE